MRVVKFIRENDFLSGEINDLLFILLINQFPYLLKNT